MFDVYLLCQFVYWVTFCFIFGQISDKKPPSYVAGMQCPVKATNQNVLIILVAKCNGLSSASSSLWRPCCGSTEEQWPVLHRILGKSCLW